MSNPLNQEYKEAEQLEANREREKFLSELPKKQKAQFDAVTAACNILLEADIPFYLFPYLPSVEYKGKHQVWQWNSLVSQMEYDKSGKPKEKSAKVNREYHAALFTFFFEQFKDFFGGNTVSEKLTNLPYFFHYCRNEFYKYLKE